MDRAERQRRLERIAELATERLGTKITALMVAAVDMARREEYYERKDPEVR